MKCSTCNGKGYQESTIAKDAQFSPMITRCPNPECPHVDNYYKEVKKRFHASEDEHQGEQVLPPKESIDKLIKDTSQPTPTSINITIPKDILENPQALNTFVKAQIDRALSPDLVKDGPDLTSLLPEQTPRKVDEYEQDYEHLPDDFIATVKRLKEQDESAQVMVTTPFGPVMCEKLSDANRIMGILNSYWNNDEELAKADEADNVIIFPLDRALGL